MSLLIERQESQSTNCAKHQRAKHEGRKTERSQDTNSGNEAVFVSRAVCALRRLCPALFVSRAFCVLRSLRDGR